MKIKRYPPLVLDIADFAESHNLVMEIHQRSSRPSPSQYYAHFSNAEVMENTMLVGEYGNGASETEAIEQYATRISGKRLAIHAGGSDRREIVVPILMYTPPKKAGE